MADQEAQSVSVIYVTKESDRPPFLLDCMMMPRPGEGNLFEMSEDKKHIDCFLRGYAIVPVEVYESLIERLKKHTPELEH